MKRQIQVTETELLDALRQALPSGANKVRPNGAFTRDELMGLTGWGHTRVSGNLKRLKVAGRLEVVMIPGERVDGRQCQTPAYRFLRK